MLQTDDRKNLSDLSSTLGTSNRLVKTFKDEFGGYMSKTAGDLAMHAKRNITGDDTGAAQWWQDYQFDQNVTRNKLFGSALTETEKGEWEKAAINPGMRPEQIRANLARRNEAARSAAAKIANSMVADGYNRKAIEEAIGMPLEELKAPAAGGGSGQDEAKRRQELKKKYGLE
jgi:hypothetical protein